MDKVSIFCINNRQEKEVPIGTPLHEIIQQLSLNMPYQITKANVNYKSKPLSYKVYTPKKIEFFDLSSSQGMRSYISTLCFILSKAVYDLSSDLRVVFNQSLPSGYFFKIIDRDRREKNDIDAQTIRARMREIVNASELLIQKKTEQEKLIELFRNRGDKDIVTYLESTEEVYSKYYELDGYVDFYLDCLMHSTGDAKLFDVVNYKNGYLLVIPNKENPDKLNSEKNNDRLFFIHKEHHRFLDMMNIKNVGSFNKAKKKGRVSDIIQISEAYQAKQINEIAKQIVNSENKKRIILISGPSSSGKTTFRKRLEVELFVNFIKPIGISLDDYMVPRKDTPLDENGEKDYETIKSLDLDLIQDNVQRLLDGEEVQLPIYNFITGEREYRKEKLKLGENQILLIEGLHALNPKLLEKTDPKEKFAIYVSALTSTSIDDHNWISGSDNRLLRRIVRDYHYRNYSAAETIKRWDSVKRGEMKWIFPYQDNADVMFNSTMIYELAALRKYAEPILERVPRNISEYAEARRLLTLLGSFCYITDKELPPTSLLREFLGGSSFRY